MQGDGGWIHIADRCHVKLTEGYENPTNCTSRVNHLLASPLRESRMPESLENPAIRDVTALTHADEARKFSTKRGQLGDPFIHVAEVSSRHRVDLVARPDWIIGEPNQLAHRH